MTHIPAELWQLIFRYATRSEHPWFYDYIPFQTIAGAFGSRDSSSLDVKRSLALVCKQWRELVMEYLYEDVIFRHGVDSVEPIKQLLERQRHGPAPGGYGWWVRRLEFPHKDLLGECPREDQLLDILELCPKMEALVLYGAFNMARPTWTHFKQPLLDLQQLHWSSPLHAMALGVIILHSPNLKYLSLSVDPGSVFQQVDRHSYPIVFPSLEILQLNRVSATGIASMGIRAHDLPKVTHLILDALPINFGPLPTTVLHIFGAQVQVLEVTGISEIMGFSSMSTDLLRDCLNLREFIYDIRLASLSRHYSIRNSSLKCIRLHMNGSSYTSLMGEFGRLAKEVDDARMWQFLATHFAKFSGASFPHLERIVLYGDCHSIVSDIRFHPLHQALRGRGCVLEYPDETPVPYDF